MHTLQDPLIQKAAKFARIAHSSQLRKYTGEPYFCHLVEVAVLLHWAGMSPSIVAAGLLHDCIEDQGITMKQLFDEFGSRVAYLVSEVTDISSPKDGNRQSRKALDRWHLGHASPDGKAIKLADLASNTSSIVRHDPKFAKVYLVEKRHLLGVLENSSSQLLFDLARETLRKSELELGITEVKGAPV